MASYIVRFERDHPDGPPGLETTGQMPIDAESPEAARERFYEQFSDEVAAQFDVVGIETSH